MDNETNYLKINNALWDERVSHHMASGFYDLEGFRKGATSLKSIELDLLGDINGKELLHLQCHFGQDTLSLARMGARVTGLDFSARAIDAARSLAASLGLDARFICSDVHEADQKISQPAEIVFTTYGVLGWLPDLTRWARIVANCTRPGGTLLLVEFHPFVWMYDPHFKQIQYSYFNREAIVEQEEGTYADTGAPISLKSVGWNHPLADVITALITAGFSIEVFREYDYSPYEIFPDMEETAPGQYQVRSLKGKLPLVYALKAVRHS